LTDAENIPLLFYQWEGFSTAQARRPARSMIAELSGEKHE